MYNRLGRREAGVSTHFSMMILSQSLTRDQSKNVPYQLQPCQVYKQKTQWQRKASLTVEDTPGNDLEFCFKTPEEYGPTKLNFVILATKTDGHKPLRAGYDTVGMVMRRGWDEHNSYWTVDVHGGDRWIVMYIGPTAKHGAVRTGAASWTQGTVIGLCPWLFHLMSALSAVLKADD